MEEEITLEEIFRIVKQKIVVILSWSFLGVVLAGALTFFIITPKYESTSRIVVSQTQNMDQTITNTDIQTNLNLINTYQSIIKEPIILEEVLQSTESNLTLNELSNKITVNIQNNSLVFGISVKDANPYVASELANATAKAFETKIGDILEVQSVTILSEAVPNLSPVSPNIIINIVLGLIMGLIVGVGLAFLFEVIDKSVKDEKIIEKMNWINLGSIIEMTNEEIKDTRMRAFENEKKSNINSKRRRV